MPCALHRSPPARRGCRGTRVRLVMFVVSAVLAGLGGVMYASFDSSIQPTNFPAQTRCCGWPSSSPSGSVGRATPSSPVLIVNRLPLPTHTRDDLPGGAPDPLRPGRRGPGQEPGRIDRPHEAGLAFLQRDSARPQLPRSRRATGARRAGGVPVAANAGSGGSAPVLRLEQVTAGYHGIDVLHGISLDLLPGELLGILGSNGAGKSTLCNVIAGGSARRAGRSASGRRRHRPPSYWRSRRGFSSPQKPEESLAA